MKASKCWACAVCRKPVSEIERVAERWAVTATQGYPSMSVGIDRHHDCQLKDFTPYWAVVTLSGVEQPKPKRAKRKVK